MDCRHLCHFQKDGQTDLETFPSPLPMSDILLLHFSMLYNHGSMLKYIHFKNTFETFTINLNTFLLHSLIPLPIILMLFLFLGTYGNSNSAIHDTYVYFP